jgi:hypothetical protein
MWLDIFLYKEYSKPGSKPGHLLCYVQKLIYAQTMEVSLKFERLILYNYNGQSEYDIRYTTQRSSCEPGLSRNGCLLVTTYYYIIIIVISMGHILKLRKRYMRNYNRDDLYPLYILSLYTKTKYINNILLLSLTINIYNIL